MPFLSFSTFTHWWTPLAPKASKLLIHILCMNLSKLNFTSRHQLSWTFWWLADMFWITWCIRPAVRVTWDCFFFSPSMHNNFLKEGFPKWFSWNRRHLPQLIQGCCLTKLLFLGTEDSVCRPERPWPCLLCWACSWLDAYFLFDKPLQILGGFHMICVVFNWIC